MALSEPQKTIANDTHRFRVAICGRRFGKTFLAMRELAKYARIPNQRCWFVAPTRLQGKGIAWTHLKQRLGDLKWIASVNESELTLKLINGSVISIMSADAFDRMRGYSVNFIVFDEFADMDPEVWTAVRPTLSDTGGHALFIGTPKGTNSWAKDVYDMGKTNPQWRSFQFTTLDGGRVSAEEIESAKADLDERTFQQEYEATFSAFSGKIFYNFTEENIQPYLGKGYRELHVGQDFNVGKMTAVIGVRTGEDFHVIDEIVISDSNTDEIAQEIKNRYPNIQINSYPDPSARARKSSSAGRTDITILQNAGFQVFAPNAHRAVKDDINSVNSRLCSTKGQRRLFVDPRCKYTIQSLERHVFKEGTSIPDKDSGYDHLTDALRYVVAYQWPIRKDITPQPQMRWGHKLG